MPCKGVEKNAQWNDEKSDLHLKHTNQFQQQWRMDLWKQNLKNCAIIQMKKCLHFYNKYELEEAELKNSWK